MTPIKRRLCSTDDESFDSFKRRHIEQAKSEATSAAPQSSRGCKTGLVALNHSSATTLGKKRCPPRFSSNFGWGEQLEGEFGVIHYNKPELKKKSISLSRRELELTTSDGIRSPVLPNTMASTGKPNRGHFRNVRIGNKSESSHFRKTRRSFHNVNEFALWNDNNMFQMGKKDRCMSSRNHTGRPPSAQQIHKNDDECTKPSGKKPTKLIPLSNLLISAKEYYNLTTLTPIGLERNEKYNWGHLKKNAQIRNNLMRKKIRHRVLAMSSQAPVPSAEVLERRLRKNRESTRLSRGQQRPLCKPKSSAYKKLAEKHSGTARSTHLAPYTETSNQRPAMNKDHTYSLTRTQRPQASKYFPPPSKNDQSSPVRSFPDEPYNPVSTSPQIEENAGPNTRSVTPVKSVPAIRDDFLNGFVRHQIQTSADSPPPSPQSKIKTYPKRISIGGIKFESQLHNQVTVEKNMNLPRGPCSPQDVVLKHKTPLVLHSSKFENVQRGKRCVTGVARNLQAIDSRSRPSAPRDSIPIVIRSKDRERNERVIQQQSVSCSSAQVKHLSEDNPKPEPPLQTSTAPYPKEGMQNDPDRPDLFRPPGSPRAARKRGKLDADRSASGIHPVESNIFQPISSEGFVSLKSEDSNSMKSSDKCQIFPVSELLGENTIGLDKYYDKSSDTDHTDSGDSWLGFPWFHKSSQTASSSLNGASESLWGDKGKLSGSLNAEQPPCGQVQSRVNKTIPLAKADSTRPKKNQIEFCALQNPCRRRRFDFMPSYFSTRPPPFGQIATLFP